jgi:hypothetical protein
LTLFALDWGIRANKGRRFAKVIVKTKITCDKFQTATRPPRTDLIVGGAAKDFDGVRQKIGHRIE